MFKTRKRVKKCYVSENFYRDRLCSPLNHFHTQKLEKFFTPNFDTSFLGVVFTLHR